MLPRLWVCGREGTEGAQPEEKLWVCGRCGTGPSGTGPGKNTSPPGAYGEGLAVNGGESKKTGEPEGDCCACGGGEYFRGVSGTPTGGEYDGLGETCGAKSYLSVDDKYESPPTLIRIWRVLGALNGKESCRLRRTMRAISLEKASAGRNCNAEK